MANRILNLLAASFELMLAASLWGFGFVAVIWALPVWGPFPIIFLRFLLGASVGLAISAVMQPPTREELKRLLRLAVLPSVCIFVALVFQTVGLRYTTATKSAFITILYVVLVPVLESLVRRKPLRVGLWLFVLTSLIGVYLIVDPSWGAGWNRGDLLTLLCAAAAALQIIAVGRVSHGVEKSFLFNSLQSLWCLALAAACLPFQDGHLIPLQAVPLTAWIGIFSLGLGSTMIAFYLQVRAQKVLSPTVSSLFFLMESPFALVYAYLLLHERLGASQALGATLIFASAILATLSESKRKRV